MNDDEIDRALSATGACWTCYGAGRERDEESRRWHDCGTCHGSCDDPLATLRATQAVGHLLRRLIAAQPQPVNVHFSAGQAFGDAGRSAEDLAAAIARGEAHARKMGLP